MTAWAPPEARQIIADGLVAAGVDEARALYAADDVVARLAGQGLEIRTRTVNALGRPMRDSAFDLACDRMGGMRRGVAALLEG